MQEENFRIGASPYFQDVRCPIHRNDMIELENGWCSVAWWCKECQKPYQLKLIKMRKWNQEAVDKQLSETNKEKL
jgi:hypothetical protein